MKFDFYTVQQLDFDNVSFYIHPPLAHCLLQGGPKRTLEEEIQVPMEVGGQAKLGWAR